MFIADKFISPIISCPITAPLNYSNVADVEENIMLNWAQGNKKVFVYRLVEKIASRWETFNLLNRPPFLRFWVVLKAIFRASRVEV
jgi:hypothetical protein